MASQSWPNCGVADPCGNLELHQLRCRGRTGLTAPNTTVARYAWSCTSFDSEELRRALAASEEEHIRSRPARSLDVQSLPTCTLDASQLAAFPEESRACGICMESSSKESVSIGYSGSELDSCPPRSGQESVPSSSDDNAFSADISKVARRVRISATTFEVDKCAYGRGRMLKYELHDYEAEYFRNYYQLNADGSVLALKTPGVDPLRMIRKDEEGTAKGKERMRDMRIEYLALSRRKSLTVPDPTELVAKNVLFQVRAKKEGDRVLMTRGRLTGSGRDTWHETQDELVWGEPGWKYSGDVEQGGGGVVHVNSRNFESGGFQNVKVESVEARPILSLTQDPATGRVTVKPIAGGPVKLLERVAPGTKRKVAEGDRVCIGVLPYKVEQVKTRGRKQRPKLGVSAMGKRAPMADHSIACNYCLGSDNTDDNPLVHCCECLSNGQPQYKHVECVKQWEESRLLLPGQSRGRQPVEGQNVVERRKDSGRSYVLEGNCRECKKSYKMAFKDGDADGERHLFKIDEIAPPFAVLKCEGSEDQSCEDHSKPIQQYIGTQFVAAFDPKKIGKDKYKVTIGRSAIKDDVQLVNNPQASRNHSQISFDEDDEEGTFRIADMGSKFGTFLEIGPDGIELDSKKPLELRFGCMALKIEYAGDLRRRCLAHWKFKQQGSCPIRKHSLRDDGENA